MKIAYMKAPYLVEIRDEEVRALKEDEVLLQVKACGFCGSDLNGAVTRTEYRPFGHEFAGVIESVGTGVTTLAAGDHVAVESSSYCGQCPSCRNGHVELCSQRFLHAEQYNGFAEKVVAKAKSLVKFDAVSFEEAAMFEPLGVALDLVQVTDISLGDDVLILGVGPIAIMAVRLAKLRGAKHVTVGARSYARERVRLAREFGADEIIFTDQETITAGCGGKLFQKIMVTTPPETLAEVADVAAFGAVIGAIGIGKTPKEGMCTLNINRMHFKRLQLRFSHATPALFYPLCNELIASGMVLVKELISHRYSLEQMQDALCTLRDEKELAVKVMMIGR